MRKLLFLILLLPLPAFGQATLTWSYQTADVVAGGVTHFTMERKNVACAATGTFAEVAKITANPLTLTYNDPTTIPAGSTFCWRVAAVNANLPLPGGMSGYSNTVEKAGVVTAKPIAPSGLTVK